MPSKEEISELYHEDFDHFTPYIEQLSVHRTYFRNKIQETYRLLKKSQIPNPKSQINSKFKIQNSQFNLLDIGCAMGVLLEEAKKVGFRVQGVDISEDAVVYCNKKGFSVHVGTISSFARGRLTKLNSFDVITAFQVIEHERDPLRMMKTMRKLLKPGGLLVMATPNVGGWWSRLMGRRWFGFAHPEHVVLFDHQTIRKLLEEAQFTDIEVKNDSPRPFPLSFAFTRGADYFPALARILQPIGKLLDNLNIINPINPWDDMIIFARK